MKSMFRLVTLVLLLASVTVAGCGNSSGSPAAPTQTSPSTPAPSTPTSSGRLPLGTAAASSVACPGGSPTGSDCRRVSVSCPPIAPASATLRVSALGAGVARRGTIILTTGGSGTLLNGNIGLARQMIDAFAGAGVVSVEIGWDEPGIWGGPQARTLACRYATVARWVYDNLHAGGSGALFAAQGTSGGSSQIAFALTYYGLDAILALVNLGGGPPGCPLCSADGVHGPEPLLPAEPPAVNGEPQLAYPNTAVRFFLGANEPTPDIVTDAHAYFTAITSSNKTFTTVPGTPHDIETTQAGVDAYVLSVREVLK